MFASVPSQNNSVVYKRFNFTTLHIKLFPGLPAPFLMLRLPEQYPLWISPLSYRGGLRGLTAFTNAAVVHSSRARSAFSGNQQYIAIKDRFLGRSSWKWAKWWQERAGADHHISARKGHAGGCQRVVRQRNCCLWGGWCRGGRDQSLWAWTSVRRVSPQWTHMHSLQPACLRISEQTAASSSRSGSHREVWSQSGELHREPIWYDTITNTVAAPRGAEQASVSINGQMMHKR